MADTPTSPRSPKTTPKRAPSAAKGSRARSNGAGAARARATSRARAAGSTSAGRGVRGVRGVRGAQGARGARGNATRTVASRGTVDRVGDYAERAVLIPVGAALVARELVASSVSDVISSYSTPTKAQAQLRKFEHRGSTARTRLEREVRKTRTRVERELRERRRELDRRREHLSKSLSTQVEQTQAQIEKTQAQIEDALRARLDDGADLASRVQERVLNLV
jgi:hypothetical protein